MALYLCVLIGRIYTGVVEPNTVLLAFKRTSRYFYCVEVKIYQMEVYI